MLVKTCWQKDNCDSELVFAIENQIFIKLSELTQSAYIINFKETVLKI